MGLVAAKCTQCGANIEVDASKDAGICSFCGTAFVTEKAINNYIVNNTFNIQNAELIIPNVNVENLRKAIPISTARGCTLTSQQDSNGTCFDTY